MRPALLLALLFASSCGTTTSATHADAAPDGDAPRVDDLPDAAAPPPDVPLPLDATPPDAPLPPDAPPPDAPLPADAPPDPCVARGGTCVPAMRTLGFSLTCPPGAVTADGRPTWMGPGTDLLPGGRIAGGCPADNDSGFEAALYGCCTPADAGR